MSYNFVIMKKSPTLTQSQGKYQESDILATLLLGAGIALILQILSAASGYWLQVMLARWLGVKEYGAYDYACSIGIFLAFLAGLGLPTTVLRFISEYKAQQDWARLRGMIWGSWRQTLIASAIAAICGTIVLYWLDISEYKFELILGIWTVPVIALANLQKEIVRAFRQLVMAYAPFLIVYPLLLLLVVFIWRSQQNLDSKSVLGLSIISLLVILAIQLHIFQSKISPEINNVRPIYAMEQWWRVSLPLMFIEGSYMILNQTDTLMIGSMLGAKEVGIYSAALKTSMWVNFILTAVNAISAPMFAELYAQNERVVLQKLVSTSAKWMFFPAFAISLGLIIFANPILQMFGSEFIAAKPALIALILGQLVNVGAGSVGYLLNMTGHHRECAKVVGISALVNLVLNLIGIHYLGILGAAIGFVLHN